MVARVNIAYLAGVLLFAGCIKASLSEEQQLADEKFGRVIEQLKPLHRPISKPGPTDWLANHDEPGQTFLQYVKSGPVLPSGTRRIIYIQPLGDFTDKQREIVKLSADFMGRFFSLPVRIRDDLPLSVIPDKARRKHPQWGVSQILTTHVLDKLLKPRLPEDAAMYIAFTASDLWPGQGWNFVFGQATLRDRVGVWSLHRHGDPDAGDDAFKLCLLRTMATAVHEAGHMFSMYHCTQYECLMCGSNSLEESDRRPIWCCPECVSKVCWATGADPVARYNKLAEFCRANGFTEEGDFYLKSAAVLEGLTTSSRPTTSFYNRAIKKAK